MPPVLIADGAGSPQAFSDASEWLAYETLVDPELDKAIDAIGVHGAPVLDAANPNGSVRAATTATSCPTHHWQARGWPRPPP